MADKIVNRGIKIWIDGKEVPRNVTAIRTEIRALIKDQSKMTIGAEDYIRTGKKIAYLNSILSEHRQKTADLSKEYRSLTQRAKDGFASISSWFNRNLAVVGAIVGSITGASLAFRKLAEDVAKMDDVYSDVMKTTGMTRSEVVAMNDEFKKIDTRTSREELNKIAEAGGRIGIAKENIIEFTRSMDIANVALGDSFSGGVEEISTQLGKLKSLFQETKDMEVEKAYLSIGSAINELGAKGAASEPNIANFALRVGSLPDSLKPSISETLALGAAFEESGIEAEISSRAYNIFLKQAATETEKFAKVMRLPVNEVENLINTDPLEFFLQFAEGMRGMDATQTAKTLEYLGVNADGANKAIGAAANNTARFRELVDLSNKSFEEGTSVVNEYNIKNSNLAAELEKARKGFKETALELGERLNPVLLKSTKGTTYLIRSMIELPKWLRENKGLILILAIVIGNYTLAVNKARIALLLKNTQLKLSTFFLAANRAANLAAAAAQALFTGNITRARIAMQVFNKTMLLNPYVLLGTAIAAVTIGVYKLVSGFNRLNEEGKAKASIDKQVSESTARERTELDLLLRTARNENLSKETRLKAIEKLNAISPKHLGFLSLETINTNAAKNAVNDYTKALEANAKQKAIAENITKLYSDKFKNEAEIAELDMRIDTDKSKGFFRSNLLSQNAWKTRQSMLRNRNEGIDQRLSIYESMSDKAGGFTGSENGGTVPEDPGPDFWVPDDKKKPGGGTSTIAQEERKKLNDEIQEIEIQNFQELAKIKRDYIDDDRKTEEQYNQELLDQQRDFLEKKKLLLQDTLSSVTDPEVQADIKKQIETLNNDLLDLDVNYRNQVLANLKKEQDESIKLTEENADKRKQIFEKYGINELTTQKDSELAVIDEYERLGILTHEEALRVKAALDDKYLREEIDKRLEGYYEIASSVNSIFSDLSGTMDNLISAEENRTALKYDKQIKAARKAGKDTTKLEEKKEEEIARIRAKNADKQFVLTIASVIASTAMAAIDAYANALKIPIVGLALAPIAAAAAVAFGGSQIAVAKQQRDAAKEGYYIGGFTGGDDPREVRGYFPDGQPYNGKEFVVNHRGVSNPNIRPVLDAFDMAQRTGTISSMSKQDIARALNVNTANATPSSGSNDSARDSYVYDTIDRLAKTVERLSNQIDEGIPAIATISGEKGIAKKLDEFNRLTKHARG